MRKKILLSISLFISTFIFSQTPSLQWVKTVNGDFSDYDVPSKTCKDVNGNVYITGWNGGYDIFLVKFDNNGNEVYRVIYDGPLNSYDRSYDVIADNSGNAYIAGYASASTQGQNQYPAVIKYDANGNKLWEYISSTPSSTFNSIAFDNPTNPNYIYAAGGQYYLDSMSLDKISVSSGVPIWTKKIEKGGLLKVKADNNGNPYVCGFTGENYATNGTDGYVAKINANGNLVWKQTYNGLADSADIINNVEILNAGGVIVAGSVRDTLTTAPWVKYMRISSTGQIIWNKTFHIGGWQTIQTDMATNSVQSAFYITSYINTIPNGGPTSSTNAYLQAVDPNGNTIFVNTFFDNSGYIMKPATVKVNNYGDIFVLGFCQGSSAYGFLWKTNPLGNTVCSTQYTTLFTSGTFLVQDAIGLVFDNSSHPLGVFTTYNSNTVDDASLVQFSSSCGINWEVFYNGKANSVDYTSGVAVDNAGNSYVGGFVINDYTMIDGVITKYDPYGNQMWSNFFDLGNSQDWSNGFGMDAQANLYLLSGVSIGNASLAKFDSAGNQLWIAAGGVHADRLVIDGVSNNIYIAGGSHGIINTGKNSREFCVQAISNAGVPGAFHSLSNNPKYKSIAGSIAVDNSGNTFVAGGVQKDTNIYNGNILVQKFNSSAQPVGYYIVPGIDSLALGNAAGVAKIVYNPTDGFLYLAAYAKPQSVSYWSQYLLKIDPSSFAVSWIKIYNDTNNADYTVNDLIISPANEIYLTGATKSTTDGFFYVQKWDNNGNILWERTFSQAVAGMGNDNEAGKALALDNLGNVYATGMLGPTFIFASISLYVNTFKITPSGTVLWKKAYEDGGDAYYYGQYIAVNNNRVFIGANLQMGGAASNSDIGILKYCDIPDPQLSSPGPVSICTNSSYAIAAPAASSYQWNTGATNQTIAVTTAGNYYCTVYQSDGCNKNTDTLLVNVVSAPTAPDICMVTVDDSSKHNLILWDKTSYANKGVIGFNIYREDLTNIYHFIGAVPFANLSEYVDLDGNANPNTTTKRYKISAVDSCGNESQMSNYHNTIYIVSSGGGQFSWNQLYTIESSPNPVVQYILFRDDYNTGSWHAIDSTAGTQFNINDVNFSTFQPTANWRVNTQWNINCTPTAKLGSGNSTQTTIIRSKSNITNNRVSGIQSASSNMLVTVYPNPAQNILTVNVPSSPKTTIKLMSLVGEEIISIDLLNENSAQLDISKLASGVYLLEVSNASGKFVKRIVKE